MITSAAFSLRNKVLLFLLALLLAGCIQPDAPYPGGSGVGANTPIFPPTSIGGQPLPTALFPTIPSVDSTPSPMGTNLVPPTFLPTSAPQPLTPVATIVPTIFVPTIAATSEPDRFIWGFYAVGPEQVAIMFYQNATGMRCARYIYRSKVLERCPQPGQTLVTVSGVEPSADNQQYTIIAGRALNNAIRTVTIEFADGSSQPIATNAGGYITVIQGIKQPIRATPIDQSGNLVGAVVPIQ